MTTNPLHPALPDEFIRQGGQLYAEGQVAEALKICLQGLALVPDNLVLLNQSGIYAAILGDKVSAEAAYRRAIALNADYAEAHYNLAILLHEHHCLDEAEVAYRRFIQLMPDDVEVHHNLGALLHLQNRLNEAEVAYRHALAVKPDHVEARHNFSLLLLQRGKLREGWLEYEARHAPGKLATQTRPPPIPAGVAQLLQQWKGESLNERSLLIWPEQGFGDAIQFVRYLPSIRAKGVKHLALVCPSALKALFSTQNLADEVICIDDWRPEMGMRFDFWCYLLSLPQHFETTLENLPAKLPYLAAEPDRIARWADCLPKSGLRVALVWKGSPTHANDRNRSLPSITSLIPLWSQPGITFISLQKGNGEEEVRVPSSVQPLTHLGSRIADFADIAAILSQMDLLICVDTAVAHLAGALAKPCWVLLSYTTDWRWFEERVDSPWYPGVMRLFRQTSDRDWDSVVAHVVVALKEWSAETRNEQHLTDSNGDAWLNPPREQHHQYGEEFMGSLKRFNLRSLSAATGICTLVQSGTGLGASINWAMQCQYAAVHSVERETSLHAKAAAMFSECPQVHLAQGDSVSFLRTQGPMISGPKLVYLNAYFASDTLPGKGPHECLLSSPESFWLLDEVTAIQSFFGPEDVLIIDNARMYQSGDFQLGECPPVARCWHQLAELEALFDRWSDSHFLCILQSDQGYFCLIPNAFEKQYPTWLNILPHDTDLQRSQFRPLT